LYRGLGRLQATLPCFAALDGHLTIQLIEIASQPNLTLFTARGGSVEKRVWKVTEERGGHLYIPGQERPLTRDHISSIAISVSELRVTRGFANKDGKTTPSIRVGGKAYLENCTLSIAGLKEKTRDCSFTAAAVYPDQKEHQWRIEFGFVEEDWELGFDDDWYVQGYIPEIALYELITAFEAGEADGIYICCTSDLWADPLTRHAPNFGDAPIYRDIDWKLSRGKYGAGPGQGTIRQFTWEVTPKRRPASIKLKPDDTEAFEADQRLANDICAEHDPQAAPAPAMEKSNWGWWVAGGLAVLGYLVLRNG
jgi:hypothetical protein